MEVEITTSQLMALTATKKAVAEARAQEAAWKKQADQTESTYLRELELELGLEPGDLPSAGEIESEVHEGGLRVIRFKGKAERDSGAGGSGGSGGGSGKLKVTKKASKKRTTKKK